jgi:hypothetical protein
VLFLGMFSRLLIIDLLAGREDIFFPGIIAIAGAALVFLLFCIRRIIKNYKLFKSLDL